MNTQTQPIGATHKKTEREKCHDGNYRLFTRFYKIEPNKFSDGSDTVKIQYFNDDFETWQGCINEYDKIRDLYEQANPLLEKI